MRREYFKSLRRFFLASIVWLTPVIPLFYLFSIRKKGSLNSNEPNWKPVCLACICLVALLITVSCSDDIDQHKMLLGNSESSSMGNMEAGIVSDITAVPKVITQFVSIDGQGGVPFTFRYWNEDTNTFIGDDPTVKTHYQGVTRVQGADGGTYFYLPRNGNPIMDPTDYPGEILIVEMGSRPADGEILGTNCRNDDFENCQPPAEDITCRSIQLNGYDLGWGVDWKHPGSGQQVGNLLFIPVEKTCNYDSDVGHCVGDEVKRGAILVFKIYDMNDPGVSPCDPEFIGQIERMYDYPNGVDDPIEVDIPIIGTLAVTINSENYLFAHTTGGEYKKETALTFYELAKSEVVIAAEGGQAPILNKLYTWNADNLLNMDGVPIGEEEWREEGMAGALTKKLDYQMINFVYDTDDSLFLIGTDKSSTSFLGIPTVYDDYAKLYKIERFENLFVVKYIQKKHFYLSRPEALAEIGSLDAGGGIYISPSGKLMLYTTGHDNDWDAVEGCSGDSRCKSLEMGEFSPRAYPPIITQPANQVSDEGIVKIFDLGSFEASEAYGQSYNVNVNWGDDTTDDIFPAIPGEALALEHTYVDGPADFSVVITVTDSIGFSSSGSFIISVRNVAPQVNIDTISDETGLVIGADVDFSIVGLRVEVLGRFTDPGILDLHEAEMDWGDLSTPEDLSVNQETMTAIGSHIYQNPGEFTLTLTITDNDGGQGSANATLRIVDPGDAIEYVCAEMSQFSQNQNIREALGKLCGNSDGLAQNGALDMFQKDNLNAALVKLYHAAQLLDMPEPAEGDLDMETYQKIISLIAKSIALTALRQAEVVPVHKNELVKIEQAEELVAEGDDHLSEGQYPEAVELYKIAQRKVQGIF